MMWLWIKRLLISFLPPGARTLLPCPQIKFILPADADRKRAPDELSQQSDCRRKTHISQTISVNRCCWKNAGDATKNGLGSGVRGRFVRGEFRARRKQAHRW